MDPLLQAATASHCYQGKCVRVGASRVLMAQGCCNTQARFNLAHAYKDNLTRTAGSLGIGQVVPWFEYGGAACATVADFLALPVTGKDTIDAHVWLEDGTGRVWDVVTPHMVFVALSRGKGLGYDAMHIIEGETKAALARRGLVYVTASEPELLVRVIDRKGAPADQAQLEGLFV